MKLTLLQSRCALVGEVGEKRGVAADGVRYGKTALCCFMTMVLENIPIPVKIKVTSFVII